VKKIREKNSQQINVGRQNKFQLQISRKPEKTASSNFFLRQTSRVL
jgi:hypothetical protein